MTYRNTLAGIAAMTFIATTGSTQAAMVAHYSFDETSGTTLSDGVGTAHGSATDVAFSASAAGVSGSGLGNAGTFNGTTSEVSFGGPGSFDLGAGDFTIAGWFKTPENTTTGGFGNKPVFQNISYSGGGWVFEVGRADRSYAGEIFFTVGGGSSSSFGQTQLFSDGRVDDNQWHWVAAVNSGGTLSMYIDGVLQADGGSMDVGTSTATSPTGTEAQFAARGAAQALFNGSLDDWRIYDEALGATLDGSNTLNGGALYGVWQVPEPTALSLLLFSAGGLALRRRRDCASA